MNVYKAKGICTCCLNIYRRIAFELPTYVCKSQQVFNIFVQKRQKQNSKSYACLQPMDTQVQEIAEGLISFGTTETLNEVDLPKDQLETLVHHLIKLICDRDQGVDLFMATTRIQSLT